MLLHIKAVSFVLQNSKVLRLIYKLHTVISYNLLHTNYVLDSVLSKLNLFIYYLFLAALGLRCCAQAFSSCGERGLLFVAMRGLLIAVASLVAEHGLAGFSSCG